MHIRQPSSVAVYQSMWDAFARWCVARGLAPQALRAEHIEAFVLSRAEPQALSDRHAWRLLSLLDSVLRRQPSGQAWAGGAEPPAPGGSDSGLPAPPVTDQADIDRGAGQGRFRRPGNRAAAELLLARPHWRYANASDRDALPEFLTGSQAAALVRWLLDEHSGYHAPGAAAGSWQSLRNRASVALQLGAGLTPGDIRAALVSGILAGGKPGSAAALPWRIRLPRHGAVAERDAPIAPWAARLLQQWLEVRTATGLAPDVLFPGTRKAKVWAKVAQYQTVNGLLLAAGVNQIGGGSFVLRHTFALRQLRRGHNPEAIARWLGVSDPGVMARYQRVLYEAEDLV